MPGNEPNRGERIGWGPADSTVQSWLWLVARSNTSDRRLAAPRDWDGRLWTAAAIAIIVDTEAGAYLVSAGLLGHAAWDVYHHRLNKVVVRSMAEFCCILDTLAIVIAAVRE